MAKIVDSKLIREEVFGDKKKVYCYELEVTNINNQKKVFTFFSRKPKDKTAYMKNGNSMPDVVEVMVIAVDKLGKEHFVLLDQYRPTVGCRLVEFPAGKIDPGMTPKEQIVLEMKQETGLSITEKNIVNILPRGFKSAGITDEDCVFGTVKISYEELARARQELEGFEDINVNVIPVEKGKGYIQDKFVTNTVAVGVSFYADYYLQKLENAELKKEIETLKKQVAKDGVSELGK
ncbi:MAG: NUDIX domain-containing protein [Spirochaetales bacterium]